MAVEVGGAALYRIHNTATVWHDDVLRQALCTLEPEQQQVIALRFLAGMSSSEIAQSLEQTECAVKLLQRRALRHLSLVVAIPASTEGELSGR
ncbi:MAG: sigma-70 family RNA polymerase sigma factor [Chloroflexota bacterium]|nr:sigma-70 family RNA polymerase sigma factor [Chloroflexota bacterium]